MIAWFVMTLRQNAEPAFFLALALGYAVGLLKTIRGTVIVAIFASKTVI